jgi:DNA invertase Pin-like site-specific DNA recombinase
MSGDFPHAGEGTNGFSTVNAFFRERRAAGIANAKRRGVYEGRKPGSTKGEPSRAKELRAKGLSAAAIAAAMGTCERTIWRYLAADAG